MRIADRSKRNFPMICDITDRLYSIAVEDSSLSWAIPYSGCHGDRVETVSRGREPLAIRDPAKWTVPSTFGYRKVKLVYTHTTIAGAPFKPLSTIHGYRSDVRLKKRFSTVDTATRICPREVKSRDKGVSSEILITAPF